MVGSNVIYVNCYPDNLVVGVSIRIGSQSLLYTVVALAEPATQNRRRLADGLPIFLEQEVTEVINSSQGVIIVTLSPPSPPSSPESSSGGLSAGAIVAIAIGGTLLGLLLLLLLLSGCCGCCGWDMCRKKRRQDSQNESEDTLEQRRTRSSIPVSRV